MPNHSALSPAGAIDSSPGRKPWEEEFDKSKQAPEGRKNMAQTFTNLLTHVIFSTKERVPSIRPEWKPDLLAYLGGIIRELDGKAVAINGAADHIHMLLWMPPTRSVSETLRVLKTNSSRWVNQECGRRQTFAWQSGYGAFSVSHSNAPAVLRYIHGQEKHHQRVSFQEEFVAFLRKNGVEYDERYIWK